MKQQLPVMQQALGNSWNDLADVLKKHYGLSPGSNAELTMSGELDEVYHSNIAKIFILSGQIFGALVPYRGRHIPTTVKNWTTVDSKAMYWHRTMLFPDKPPFVFKSRMVYLQDNDIVEYVKYGMGVRMRLSVKDGALVYRGIGFIWKLGKINIPIPNWAILGDSEIIEQAISDKEFKMEFTMRHPLFGRTFAYSGKFFVG